MQVIEAWSQWSLYGLKTDKAMRNKVHNLIKRLAEAFHAEGLVRSASGLMCWNLAESSVSSSTYKPSHAGAAPCGPSSASGHPDRRILLPRRLGGPVWARGWPVSDDL